jgi:cell wall-associated NlpC family hydrolase
MRRRLALLVCLLLTLLAWASSAAGKPATSWAQAELKAVVAAGLMARETAARPDDALTRSELETIRAGLLHVSATAASTRIGTVTMSALDANLVTTLGLADSARLFTQSARSAGLAPPARFGTEAVARLLGLRTNHPASLDNLELSPSEPASHAEAAYSAARILRLPDRDVLAARDLAATFVAPAPTPWQKRVLSTAVRLIGYPYVWGGESETTDSPYGPQPHGGFDCSGFVWRVYKLETYAGGGGLADVLQGRTTYAMSGEVKPANRIGLTKLQPADVIFFGGAGPTSKPAQIDHMGIYLGNGWFIHASRYGVALAPLTGWYSQRFAWGRRPLAEAHLVAAS